VGKRDLLIAKRQGDRIGMADIIQVEHRNAETDIALGISSTTPKVDIRKLIIARPPNSSVQSNK